MREGQYTTTQDGQPVNVQFTDADVLRDVADLWAVVQGEYEGTPSMESEQLKSMLGHLQSGAPLSGAEFALLNRIRQRHRAQLSEFRASDDNDTQGWVPDANPDTGRVAGGLQEAAPSTTQLDKFATAPHLHDTVMDDLAHAALHAKRLLAPDVKADAQSQQFNAEHTLKHIEGAQEHAKKLDAHLSATASDPKAWQQERDALKQMREATLSNFDLFKLAEGKAPPPPNLRQAAAHDEAGEATQATPVHECGTCSMYDDGQCWGYGNFPVDADWLCDSWAADPNWRAQDAHVDAGMAPLHEVQVPVATDTARELELPIVCVDFDGVIHQGPHGLPGKVEGEPIKGAAAGLATLAKRYRVVVLTARHDLAAVEDWLRAKKLDQDVFRVTNVKPPAAAYIDDRAVHFDNWADAVKAADPNLSSAQMLQVAESARRFLPQAAMQRLRG